MDFERDELELMQAIEQLESQAAQQNVDEEFEKLNFEHDNEQLEEIERLDKEHENEQLEIIDADEQLEQLVQELEMEQPSVEHEQTPQWQDYVPPPVSVFKAAEYTGGNIDQNECKRLLESLARLRINAKLAYASVGANVVSYVLKSRDRAAFRAAKGHSEVIAYDLGVPSIRVSSEFLHYERGIFGSKKQFFDAQTGKKAEPIMSVVEEEYFIRLEIPIRKPNYVSVKNVINSNEFASKNGLVLPLGVGAEGEFEVCNLEKLPHLIIGGGSGSGKSMCINSLIAGLLTKNSPADLRLLLIDAKMCEFASYSGLPHSLTKEPINDPSHTINALKWVQGEMQRRFDVLAQARAKDIDSFNCGTEGAKMPRIVIIFDEVSAIFMTNKKVAEQLICSISQKGRAAGIHLILSTQRACVDVLSSLIRSNIASRIVFSVSGYMESRILLDASGAERLIGNGDMLFLDPLSCQLKRIQGCFIGMDEVQSMADFIKQHNEAHFDKELEKSILAQ